MSQGALGIPLQRVGAPALPAGQEPQQQDSLYIRVYAVYARGISFLIHAWPCLPVFAIGTILLEPFNTLRVLCAMIWHTVIQRKHEFSGINPRVLNGNQREIRPILFLHSNACSPASCTGIAAFFANSYAPPIFTVQLTCGVLCDNDRNAINAKIDEIKRLYGDQNLAIDLIGHSRGGDLAYEMRERNDVHRIVTLGTRIPEENDKILAIHGRFDRLAFQDQEARFLYAEEQLEPALERLGPPQNASRLRFTLTDGHLSLLYSDRAHNMINGWLEPESRLPARAPAAAEEGERRPLDEAPVDMLPQD